MTKKHQVHLIQTYGPVHYGIWKGIDNKLFYMQGITSAQRPNIPQHLYITSGEEIQAEKLEEELKNGCIFISQNGIVKVLTNHRVKAIGNYYKIVATNNPDLWDRKVTYEEYLGMGMYTRVHSTNKGVAKIPSEFVEEYVNKEGNIKEVELACYEEDNTAVTMEGEKIGNPILRADGTVIINPFEGPTVTTDSTEDVVTKSLRALADFIRENPEEARMIGKEAKAMGCEGPTVSEYFDMSAVSDILNYMCKGRYHETNPVLYQYVADFLMSNKRKKLEKMYTRDELKEAVMEAVKLSAYENWNGCGVTTTRDALKWFDETYPK